MAILKSQTLRFADVLISFNDKLIDVIDTAPQVIWQWLIYVCEMAESIGISELAHASEPIQYIQFFRTIKDLR